MGLHLFIAVLVHAFSAASVFAWPYVLDTADGVPRFKEEATYFNKLAVDAAGDVIACGILTSSSDSPGHVTVVKLSGKSGSLIWQHIMGGSPNHRATSDCNGLSVDQQGDVLVGGRIAVIAYDISQFVLAKLAGDTGHEVWIRWLGDIRDYTSSSLSSLAVDPGGDVVAVGDIRTAGYGNTVIKFSGATGSEIWHVPAGRQDAYLTARAIALDSTGNVNVAGAEYLSRSYSRLYVSKLAGNDGRETWHYEQLRPPLDSVDLSPDSRGDVFVADTTSVLKLSGTTGAVQWIRPVPAAQVSLDPSGGVIATLSRGAGVARLLGTDGSTVWQRIGDPELGISDSSPDPKGNAAATGTLLGPDVIDLPLLKLAGTAGQVVWRRTFSDSLGADGRAVMVDAAGDIIVAGQFRGLSTDPWGEEFRDNKAVVIKVWGRTGTDFPPTPRQLLSALADTIIALALPRSLENALMREVNAASALLADSDPSNDSGAADHLRLLMRRVTALRGKAIPAAGAEEILSLAEQTLLAMAGT